MNQTSKNVEDNPRITVVVRSIHTLVALALIASIAVVYYSGITKTVDIWFYLATGALFIEGAVITLNKGGCPLSYLQRKYGDDKAFFELFMPKHIAKHMFKIASVVIAIAYVVFLLGLLYQK